MAHLRLISAGFVLLAAGCVTQQPEKATVAAVDVRSRGVQTTECRTYVRTPSNAGSPTAPNRYTVCTRQPPPAPRRPTAVPSNTIQPPRPVEPAAPTTMPPAPPTSSTNPQEQRPGTQRSTSAVVVEPAQPNTNPRAP